MWMAAGQATGNRQPAKRAGREAERVVARTQSSDVCERERSERPAFKLETLSAANTQAASLVNNGSTRMARFGTLRLCRRRYEWWQMWHLASGIWHLASGIWHVEVEGRGRGRGSGRGRG